MSSAVFAFWLEAKWTLGQPCRACQARFGAMSRSAIPAAIHGRDPRRTSRSNTANATTSAAPRKAIVYFASSPTPTMTPSSGMRRNSRRTAMRVVT